MLQKRIGKHLFIAVIMLMFSCCEGENMPQISNGSWYYFNHVEGVSPVYFELHLNSGVIQSYSFHDMFSGHESVYSVHGDSIYAFSQKNYFIQTDDTLYAEYFGKVFPMIEFQDKLNSTPAIRFIELMGEDIDLSDSVSVSVFTSTMKNILWDSHFSNFFYMEEI